MIVRITPEEEARAVQRGAARAGCRVRSLDIRQTAFGPHAVGYVECPDGWAAARMLVAQAIEYAATAGARDAAMDLRRQYPDDESFARALHAAVRDGLHFTREEGEVFQGPSYTAASGGGDCDDQALLMLTLARAGGLQSHGAFLHSGGEPTHALAMLCPPSGCAYAETTVDARYGEHPLDAAKRVGILSARDDLTKGVVMIGEKDLAPIPSDYVERNPTDLTKATAESLVKLGYLDSAHVTGDPTDEVFRAAVLAFQLQHPPLATDGLTGPATRARIGELVSPSSLTANLSDAFLSELIRWTKEIRGKGARVTPLDFLAVWQSESGIRSDIANPDGHHAGLNQMGDDERKTVGFAGTVADWLTLSPEAQLPYVERYYETNVNVFARGDWSVLVDAGALYLMNYHPADVMHAPDPSFILAKRGSGDYAQNTGLDIGKKGWIEVGDMGKSVLATVNAHADKFGELARRVDGLGGAVTPFGEPSSPVGIVATIVGATALGGLLAELAGRFT